MAKRFQVVISFKPVWNKTAIDIFDEIEKSFPSIERLSFVSEHLQFNLSFIYKTKNVIRALTYAEAIREHLVCALPEHKVVLDNPLDYSIFVLEDE